MKKIAPLFKDTEVGDVVLFAFAEGGEGWCIVRIHHKNETDLEATLLSESRTWDTKTVFSRSVRQKDWDNWHGNTHIHALDPRDILRWKNLK